MSAHGWWRRNAVALVAVGVLATATVAITSVNEWNAQLGFTPTQPVTAPAGEAVELAGSSFRLGEVRTMAFGEDGVGEELPAGTIAIVVAIDVAPAAGGGLPEGCTIQLRESGGSHGDRSWNDAALADVEIPATEGTVGYCDSTATAGYTVEVPFIVPDDIDGTLTVSLVQGEALPRFAAWELAPLP